MTKDLDSLNASLVGQFRITMLPELQVNPYSEGFSSMGFLAVKVKASCLRAGDA